MHFSSVLFALGVAKTAVAGYSLVDDYSSSNFFSMFDFFQGHDPTNGFVNYVDQGTAQSDGLINTNGPVYIGVDSTNQASSGRKSVRLTSKKAYNHMLVVLDINNMPTGCGTWPAFWTVGPNWPNSGEIDIIENVNDATTNAMTLHSSAGCTISGGSSGLLQPTSMECNALVNGNLGCGFKESDSSSYGSGFNYNKGGVFAMEWTSSGVSIWRWGRGNTPSDVLGSNPNPAGWGQPASQWAGSGCDWDSHFQNQNLVFDTTFCGDWAGNAFQSCSAANNGQTCQDFVANNPSAFKNAYWSVNALKVYQTDGASTNAGSPAGTPTPQGPSPAQPTSSSVPVATPSPPEAPQPPPTPSQQPSSNNTPLSESPSGAVGTPIEKTNQGSGSNAFAGGGQPLLSNEFGSGSQGIPGKRSLPEHLSGRRMKRHLRHQIRQHHTGFKA